MKPADSANAKTILVVAAALATGLAAFLAALAGWALAGFTLWVLGSAGTLYWWNASRLGARSSQAPDTVRALVSEMDAEDENQLRLAAEVRDLLEKVGTQGHSIRDVVRYLQEHATLVAWLIDNLERATEEVSSHLAGMRANAEKVGERAGKVLDGSRRGLDFVSTIGTSTEALFQDSENLTHSVQEANAAVTKVQYALDSIESAVGKLSTASDHSTKFVANVAGTMGDIRESMRQSLDLFEQVAAYTQRGRDVVNTVGRGVEDIRRSSESTMQRVDELSKKSRQIEQILGIITEVADETNLLALNAAILAAQAGERGAAFAVVAEQIRSLAHRTQESIRHIEGIVREVQDNVREANSRMMQSLDAVRQGETYGREAVDQLSRIEAAVNEAVAQARRIAEAAEQQNQSATEMVTIAGDVNKDLHTVVSNVQQSTRDISGFRGLLGQLSVLSDSLRKSAQTNHQSALDVSNLMRSFVQQMEDIDGLVEVERSDIKALDDSIGPVGESALSTKESLETIHKIVVELVRYADDLSEEVERHMPLAKESDAAPHLADEALIRELAAP